MKMQVYTKHQLSELLFYTKIQYVQKVQVYLISENFFAFTTGNCFIAINR